MPHLKLTTDCNFPDGDSIDVFWSPGPGGIVVSDLGETTRWLRMQSGDLRRAQKNKDMIGVICRSHRCEYRDGMLVMPCKDESDLESVVDCLAQAAWLIATLCAAKKKRT